MSDDSAPESDSKSAPGPRIVEAAHTREKAPLGHIEIIGSTKHGKTTLIGVAEDILKVGDSLKTKAWLLNAREFVILRKHDKPMKLPGVWYEVRTVAAPKPKAKR